MNNNKIIERINQLTEHYCDSDTDGENLYYYYVDFYDETEEIIKELSNQLPGYDYKLQMTDYDDLFDIVPMLIEFSQFKFRPNNQEWWFNGDKFVLYSLDDYPV